jgi:DNA polymerase I-like protein with 3'-5' exonuclease and polymerase domains
MDIHSIIHKQVENGWTINERKANLLLGDLRQKLFDVETKVRKRFNPLATYVKEITPKFNKDGKMSSVGLKWYEDWEDVICGTFSRIDWPQFNLGSRKQIARYLQHFGWKPLKFTDKGNIIVNESVLTGVKIPEAKLIAEYLMLQKRVAQVQSWVDAIDIDGRVHGYVNSCGAVTGRMTHSSPNVAQVPASYSPYGEECREVWTVPEGKKLVGVDASGLELRMLAHYMKDKEYINEILHGDIHTANQMASGLQSRDSAKTFIYALLYGAGDAKIGSIVAGSKADGKRLKTKFLNNTPSLRDLRDRVKKASQRGYLKGLDGRRIWVRSEHSALNTLLQGAGAIVMKKALAILDNDAILKGIEYKFLGNIHDEIQTEVNDEQATLFGELAVLAIKKAGEELNLRCPLDGEYKIGASWNETH